MRFLAYLLFVFIPLASSQAGKILPPARWPALNLKIIAENPKLPSQSESLTAALNGRLMIRSGFYNPVFGTVQVVKEPNLYKRSFLQEY